MQKLSIPENIPLRWELWRGFGRPELLASTVLTGAALICAVLFCVVTGREGLVGVLVITAIFAFAVCSGLFTKLENNQSIVDFILRQLAFQKEQQNFPYRKRKEAYTLVEEERIGTRR